MSYKYLTHVDVEFLADEEEVGEEADELIKGFFHARTGTKSRAFLGEGLRYVVTANNGAPEIVEEDGDWTSEVFETHESNDYELIYEENGKIRTEEISASEADEYFEVADL